MSNAAKLKKKAIELEQKKQLDKATALYIQFLQESDGSIDDVDIPLYNRVGDLMLRTGNSSDALNYYEKAVDLYAERGFLNNAIALCNKVLRQSPGRASIYYKLGKISASKGFKSDAKKNFLEYADRMQKTGQIDEAFRALKEFADLCPDQDDIRLMLAEQLSKENRQDEALEQLQKLHDKLDSEGRMAEVRATVDRMKSIDPEAVPRVSGAYRPQKSQDLIFLDTSFEQNARQRAAKPAAPPPPPARQVSDPDLVVLTLGDQPDTPVSPVHNAAVSGAFNLDLDVADESPAPAELPMLDTGSELDALPSAADLENDLMLAAATVEASMAPPAVDLDGPSTDSFSLGSDTPAALEMPTVTTLDLHAEADPVPVDLMDDRPSYVSGPPLSVDYASDLAADVTLPNDDGGLFDFRAPPRSDDFSPMSQDPMSSLDPDVAFPSFDLDDTALPSADDVTSGGSLAAALGDEPTLGTPLAEFDLPTASLDFTRGAESLDDGLVFEEMASVDATADADTVAPDDELEWPAADASAPSPASIADDVDTLDFAVDASSVAPNVTPAASAPVSLDAIDADAIDEAALRREIERGASSPPELVLDAADAPEDLAPIVPIEALADSSASVTEPEPEPQATEFRDTPFRATPAAAHDATRETPVAVPSTDRMTGWEIQRDHAERLLEAGDRAGGVRALEEVAAELERIGDLERALSIVDELIRLSPESARHHQKRVELAFRLNDRVKLIDAYLELGDALFRSGEERKARAVYQRVLELAPDDPRAQAAVESVASLSPARGSGAIPASPSAPEARPSSAPVRPRDTHVPYQPGPNHTARPGGGVTAPPPSRKPSPLDRAAAANEFVDLGEWLRAGDNPKSTRMVAEEKPPTGDEQADFQEMLKRFKQGVAENVEDEDYESHYDLGVAYKEMGLMDEAVAEFQKALRGTAHRVRAYEALGQCFVEKDQYQVAASVLTRAIALGEGDDHHLVGVLYLLGRATEALNKPAAALDYYQRVFAVDIEFRDVAERISEIERKAT